MRQIIRVKVLLVVAGVLLALAVAGTVFAQTGPKPGGPDSPTQGNWGGCHGNGTYQNTMWEALATSLGLTTDDLTQRLQSGESIRDIAKEKGLSDADLIKALRSAMQSTMDQAVASGQMTREQADSMLQYMQSHMDDEHWLAMTDMMGSGGHGWGSMGGMMGSGGWGSMMGPGGWSGGGSMMGPGGWSGGGSMMGPGNGPGGTSPGGGRRGDGASMMGRFF